MFVKFIHLNNAQVFHLNLKPKYINFIKFLKILWEGKEHPLIPTRSN